MNIDPLIRQWAAEIASWRHEFHAHPELGYEEQHTSDFVAEKLVNWGVEVHRGVALTGVVGSLRGRLVGSGSIGLRADMDALPLTEVRDLPYKSRIPGKMHACGHDGHTAMLLGAARYLAETRDFAGTVHFIFQPAEEGQGGGERMVREGLFERFPCDAVYAVHNWPQTPLGTAAVRAGPLFASMDLIEIEVTGRGGHAALPHLGVDPIVVASQIVMGLQTLVSRTTNPIEPAVISITSIHAGTAHNVIADSVRMLGTARALSEGVRDSLEQGVRRISTRIAEAMNATATVRYERKYPVTISTASEAEAAARAAATVLGPDRIIHDMQANMGAEDFSFMARARPGAYVALGQGAGTDDPFCHDARYDFNDSLLPIGVAFWVTLVQQQLRSDSTEATR